LATSFVQAAFSQQGASLLPCSDLDLLDCIVLPDFSSPRSRDSSSLPLSSRSRKKRIALVVGNGNYAKEPLATAANDAGLIAQTLQAAGFDVIGARDLDGDTLRKSFRDFIQKAEASPSDTVAIVYLAGYGSSSPARNYFVPVDSAINHDTDIPIEGMRISDYTRQLASLPLKASVVVLDAARQQPFVQGGEPIAAGWPGRARTEHAGGVQRRAGNVAPNEPGPTASTRNRWPEMIRTGGLSLPEVFDRVRLRVGEASKARRCRGMRRRFSRHSHSSIGRLMPRRRKARRIRWRRSATGRSGISARRTAYTAALERDTVQGYEDFLAAYAGRSAGQAVRANPCRAPRGGDLAPDLFCRYAGCLLVLFAALPPRTACGRLPAVVSRSSPRRWSPRPSFAMLDYDVPPPPSD